MDILMINESSAAEHQPSWCFDHFALGAGGE
jgi:hypothetical protein